MINSNLHDLTDDSFDDRVKRSVKPAVISFWAPWCEPCKIIDPILEKMAEKYAGTVEFMRMNIDEEKGKPTEYAVRSIPTILFFKGGEIANQMIDVQSEDAIEKAIRGLL